jgi:hypothetical protein
MADRYNYGANGEYLGKSSDTPPGSGGGCGCIVLAVIAFAIFSGSGSNNSTSSSSTNNQEANHEWEIIKNLSKKFSIDGGKEKLENVEEKNNKVP